LELWGFDCRPGRKGFFSQRGQDEIIFTEFFAQLNSVEFPKVFLDVGCNHPVIYSNSYFFETNQSFRVIAVDALAEVRERWTTLRPAAEFIECAVGACDGETGFDVVEGSNIDSMHSSVTGASEKKRGQKVSHRNVKVRRLKDILAERTIREIGIVSIDVEGYEYEALLGMDFRALRAWILIVENNGNDGVGSDRIRDLLINNGYCYYARIWNLDDIFVHSDVLKAATPSRETIANVGTTN
jgi:FkbM family methyltransferase